MFRGLALAMAYLKIGFKTRRSSIYIYPNKFIYSVLNKFLQQGLILGYGIYTNKQLFYTPGVKLNKTGRIKRRSFLISVYLKYSSTFESVLHDIALVSTAGHRVYFKYAEVYKAYVRGDVYLISTSGFGLLFTYEIILQGLDVGGEVVLRVYY